MGTIIFPGKQMPIAHTDQPQRCPEPYVLDKYTFGILSGPDVSAVGQHLLVCPDCQAKSESLERAIFAFTVADHGRSGAQ
jgi:hypothetical protein